MFVTHLQKLFLRGRFQRTVVGVFFHGMGLEIEFRLSGLAETSWTFTLNLVILHFKNTIYRKIGCY